jgi:hypothetical protein
LNNAAAVADFQKAELAAGTFVVQPTFDGDFFAKVF